MNKLEIKLFEILYCRSFVYRENPPFKLVSGKESFYYYDCKATTLNQEGLSLTGKVFYNRLKDVIIDEEIQGFGGLTLGADPISVSTAIAAFEDGTKLSPIIVRKEAKKHGTQKWIEGDIDDVKNVIVVDDVITTGGSTITAIERLREAGFKVVKAAVLIDREEGGRENIEALGVDVIAMYTKSDFDNRRIEI